MSKFINCKSFVAFGVGALVLTGCGSNVESTTPEISSTPLPSVTITTEPSPKLPTTHLVDCKGQTVPPRPDTADDAYLCDPATTASPSPSPRPSFTDVEGPESNVAPSHKLDTLADLRAHEVKGGNAPCDPNTSVFFAEDGKSIEELQLEGCDSIGSIELSSFRLKKGQITYLDSYDTGSMYFEYTQPVGDDLVGLVAKDGQVYRFTVLDVYASDASEHSTFTTKWSLVVEQGVDVVSDSGGVTLPPELEKAATMG